MVYIRMVRTWSLPYIYIYIYLHSLIWTHILCSTEDARVTKNILNDIWFSFRKKKKLTIRSVYQFIILVETISIMSKSSPKLHQEIKIGIGCVKNYMHTSIFVNLNFRWSCQLLLNWILWWNFLEMIYSLHKWSILSFMKKIIRATLWLDPIERNWTERAT